MCENSKCVLFMKDEIDEMLFTIPASSVVWCNSTIGRSRIRWFHWIDGVVNAKKDTAAFTNAEMILNMTDSACPSCILKHHSGTGYIYAQILEINDVATAYQRHGVNKQSIGEALLWPLSYNQHILTWNKICDELPPGAALRSFPPVEPAFLTLTNDGRFAGPETRPRPCVIEGAYITRMGDETSAADRLALLVNPTSRFLFRNGKTVNERHRRATMRYIGDTPDRHAHKRKLEAHSQTRKQKDRQEMKALYNGEGTLSDMHEFINNVPRVIADLRVIAGVPIAHQRRAASDPYPKQSFFGDTPDALPYDLQCLIVRRCAMSIISDPDIDRSRQCAHELCTVSKHLYAIFVHELAGWITDMCQRVCESIHRGVENSPVVMARQSYLRLACSPLLLLDMERTYDIWHIGDKKVVRVYYEARLKANVCKKVCEARARPNYGAEAPAAVRSVSSIDLDTLEAPPIQERGEQKAPFTALTAPRFEELRKTYASLVGRATRV
jgi:hypothetical protein